MSNVDVRDIKTRVDMVCRQAVMLVSADEARALAAEIERTEVFMPIFDPTGWMRIQETAPAHRAEVQAFLAFRLALERLLTTEAVR